MKIGIPDVFSAIQNHHLAKKSADIALYEPKKQVYFQLKNGDESRNVKANGPLSTWLIEIEKKEYSS